MQREEREGHVESGTVSWGHCEFPTHHAGAMYPSQWIHFSLQFTVEHLLFPFHWWRNWGLKRISHHPSALKLFLLGGLLYLYLPEHFLFILFLAQRFYFPPCPWQQRQYRNIQIPQYGEGKKKQVFQELHWKIKQEKNAVLHKDSLFVLLYSPVLLVSYFPRSIFVPLLLTLFLFPLSALYRTAKFPSELSVWFNRFSLLTHFWVSCLEEGIVTYTLLSG